MDAKIRERFDSPEPLSTNRPPEALKATPLQFPCSPAQRSVWLLHQLDPQHPSLTLATRWRLEGKVFNGNLEKAFRLILERHPILRTSFTETNGELMQSVASQVTFRIPIIDLTTLPEADALVESERTARLEASMPFDLSAAPLLRVTHVRLDKRASVLLVTLHHLVSDAQSINILEREMRQICAALHKGEIPELPPLPLTYGDVAVWQSEQIELTQTNTEFWKRTLQGVTPFEIQPDHPRPQVLTANTRVQSLALDQELTQGLSELAQAQNCTLFTASLAVLLTLLHRYTGETDIALGSEFAGRDGQEVENLLGLFSNTLVLRNDLSGDPSFV